MTTMIAATELPRELRRINQTGRPVPPYRTIWEWMVDGRIPAEQVRGRWFIQRADIPAIAARLDLVDQAAA